MASDRFPIPQGTLDMLILQTLSMQPAHGYGIAQRLQQVSRGGRDVVGSKVLVDNYPMTVIGVAPASFLGVDPISGPALWLPAMMTQEAAALEPGWDRLLDRRAAWMHVFARLQPGVTAEQAKAGLETWFEARLEPDTRLAPEATFASNSCGGRRSRSSIARRARDIRDQIDWSLGNEWMLATLSSAFAAMALFLSIVGLYGVMSIVVRVVPRSSACASRSALRALPCCGSLFGRPLSWSAPEPPSRSPARGRSAV